MTDLKRARDKMRKKERRFWRREEGVIVRNVRERGFFCLLFLFDG